MVSAVTSLATIRTRAGHGIAFCGKTTRIAPMSPAARPLEVFALQGLIVPWCLPGENTGLRECRLVERGPIPEPSPRLPFGLDDATAPCSPLSGPPCSKATILVAVTITDMLGEEVLVVRNA
jgi:hypothetical protein